MLDAAHAAADRCLDRARRIGVDGDIGAPVFGGADGGAKFVLGELADVDGIVAGGDAASCRELQLARPQHQLLAGAFQDFRSAVGHRADARRFGAAERRVAFGRNFVVRAKIAMAAGLRDHRAARPDARPGDEAGIDRPLEAEGGAGEVANAGEASRQQALGLRRRREMNIADVGGHQLLQGQRRQHDVIMRVDQPGHEHAAAAVDRLHGRGQGLFRRLDRADAPVLDGNLQLRAQVPRFAVEQAEIDKGQGAWFRRGKRVLRRQLQRLARTGGPRFMSCGRRPRRLGAKDGPDGRRRHASENLSQRRRAAQAAGGGGKLHGAIGHLRISLREQTPRERDRCGERENHAFAGACVKTFSGRRPRGRARLFRAAPAPVGRRTGRNRP